MITEFVNGYNVTGNHATVGRDYHILNADGRVVGKAPGKVLAMAAAAELPRGDLVQEDAVPEPEPEAEAEPEPEVKAVPKPEPMPEP